MDELRQGHYIDYHVIQSFEFLARNVCRKQFQGFALRPVHLRGLRALPTVLEEATYPLDDFTHLPLLLFVFTKGDEGGVEPALGKSCLQVIEFVLVFVNSKLLYLRRCVQCFNYLLYFTASQCVSVASKEVDADEGFGPAFTLLQFGGALNRLPYDLECVAAVGDAVL